MTLAGRVMCGAVVLAAIALSTAVAPAAGQAVRLELFASGLSAPVFVTGAGDGSGRLFVVEQGGVIKVMSPGGTPSVFLDIRARVSSGGERGLLGLAFHPGYAGNGRFFVDYTRAGDGATVIAEYRVSPTDPGVAEAAETPLLVIAQPFANHNGGMIAFGPDGFLYVGMGDGGSANDPGNRAQDLTQLLGKILRIDVDHPAPGAAYSSPPDNPFAHSPPRRAEIYAYGLRNPWRFSFDRLTGALYAGDVGQGAREEVDVVTLGGNYGWRVREGQLCTGNDPARCGDPGFVAPLADYKHKKSRCSITGGYVYRGGLATLPAGAYVFGDYCSGEVFRLDGGVRVPVLSAGFFISSFGEDEAGELYVVDHGGAVYRLASDQPACGFDLRPPAAAVPALGGVASVSVVAPAGCAWTARSDAPWLRIASGASGDGAGTVQYIVAVNPGAARSATLEIAGMTFAVSQPASALACTAWLSPPIAVASSRGGVGSLTIAIGAGCAWTATSRDPWITVTSGPGGTGGGTVTYSVAPGAGLRTGSITIGGRAFRIFSF